MSWLTALANALCYWLKIKATTANYDLISRIDSDNARDEAERDRLRDLGDADSQLAADRLQARILRRSSIYVPDFEPAPSSKTEGRSDNPDS